MFPKQGLHLTTSKEESLVLSVFHLLSGSFFPKVTPASIFYQFTENGTSFLSSTNLQRTEVCYFRTLPAKTLPQHSHDQYTNLILKLIHTCANLCDSNNNHIHVLVLISLARIRGN